MRPSDAYLLPLTTLATLLTVVACGPTKDYVPIKVAPGTPLGQAVQKCSEEIRPSKAKVVTTSVSICEVGKDGIYAKVNHTFRYDVQSATGLLRLSVRPGIEYSTDVTKGTDAAVKDVVADVCGKAINGIFQRSLQRSGMGGNLDFNVIIDEKAGSDSPLLDLHEIEGRPQKTFVAKAWPDRAELYPFGLKKDTDVCEKLPKESEKSACRWVAIQAANQPFCQELAALAGHWMGLKIKDAHCKDTSAAADDSQAAAKPNPKPDADSAYMKGAFEMSPKEFFEKAALSRADLKSVFSPACSSFRTLPDETTPASRK